MANYVSPDRKPVASSGMLKCFDDDGDISYIYISNFCLILQGHCLHNLDQNGKSGTLMVICLHVTIVLSSVVLGYPRRLQVNKFTSIEMFSSNIAKVHVDIHKINPFYSFILYALRNKCTVK